RAENLMAGILGTLAAALIALALLALAGFAAPNWLVHWRRRAAGGLGRDLGVDPRPCHRAAARKLSRHLRRDVDACAVDDRLRHPQQDLFARRFRRLEPPRAELLRLPPGAVATGELRALCLHQRADCYRRGALPNPLRFRARSFVARRARQ